MKTPLDPWTNKVFYAFLSGLVGIGAMAESTHKYLQDHFGMVLFVEFLFYLGLFAFFMFFFLFFFYMLDKILIILVSIADNLIILVRHFIEIMKEFRR